MAPKGTSIREFTAWITVAAMSLFLIVTIFSLETRLLRNWLMWPTPVETTRIEIVSPPLKVFMYDFPRKFNLGMLQIDAEIDQDIPWSDDEVPPPWLERIKKQHSVEYWMMLDLLYSGVGKRGDREVTRVRDPELADLFFVPFFSSLSFTKYRKAHMMAAGTGRDHVLQKCNQTARILKDEVFKLVTELPYWKRFGGEDHILPVHHPNALRFYRELLNASIFIVADFGRTVPEVSSLKKDVVAPYHHLLPTYEDDNPADPFNSRKTLLFFQGGIKRKAGGFVRRELAKIIQNQTGVHFEDGRPSAISIGQATADMRNSKFCLNPAGDTPSSCRLFDSIVNHCVPVVISEQIELPFEDDIDYTTFALFYSTEDALKPDRILSQLRSINREQWLKMWTRLKEVSHHFEYQFPSKKNDAVNMIWKQVHRKVPAIKLKIHREQRLKSGDWRTS